MLSQVDGAAQAVGRRRDVRSCRRGQAVVVEKSVQFAAGQQGIGVVVRSQYLGIFAYPLNGISGNPCEVTVENGPATQ